MRGRGREDEARSVARSCEWRDEGSARRTRWTTRRYRSNRGGCKLRRVSQLGAARRGGGRRRRREVGVGSLREGDPATGHGGRGGQSTDSQQAALGAGEPARGAEPSPLRGQAGPVLASRLARPHPQHSDERSRPAFPRRPASGRRSRVLVCRCAPLSSSSSSLARADQPLPSSHPRSNRPSRSHACRLRCLERDQGARAHPLPRVRLQGHVQEAHQAQCVLSPSPRPRACSSCALRSQQADLAALALCSRPTSQWCVLSSSSLPLYTSAGLLTIALALAGPVRGPIGVHPQPRPRQPWRLARRPDPRPLLDSIRRPASPTRSSAELRPVPSATFPYLLHHCTFQTSRLSRAELVGSGSVEAESRAEPSDSRSRCRRSSFVRIARTTNATPRGARDFLARG